MSQRANQPAAASHSSSILKYLDRESDIWWAAQCVDPSVVRHLWPNAVKIGANLPTIVLLTLFNLALLCLLSHS